MANIHDCLDAALASGDLTQAKADAARSEYDQLVDRYENIMPRAQAEAAAKQDLAAATKRAKTQRLHMVMNQFQTMRRLRTLLEDSPNPAAALMDMFEALPGSTWKGETIEGMAQAIEARIRSDLHETLQATGLNIAGSNRNKPLLMDLIRELHGQATDSARARDMATAVRKVQDWLRNQFNAHGGDIGELENYGVRHSHDRRAISEAGEQAWIDTIYDKLDWARITDLNTGKPFAAAGELPDRAVGDAFLAKVYDNIVTNDAGKKQPAMSVGGKALYNQRAEARLLHFRDGDAWLAYNENFGAANPFDAMVGGLTALGRDVAMMRVLGPNPKAGLEYAIQVVERQADVSGNQDAVKIAQRSASRARTALHHVNGAVNQPEAEGMARFFSNLRHINVATKLGSAVVSAVTDLSTITAGAAAMGMSRSSILARAVGGLSGLTREEAAAQGFVADTLMSLNTSSARLTNDVVASDVFGRLSGFTIRASGLSWWTDNLRMGVQMEGAAHLGSQAGRGFNDLDPTWRNLLERQGINAQDWDHLRASEALYTAPNGGKFISPFYWLEHQASLSRQDAEGLALRLQASFQDLQELFVPSRRIRGSALVLGNTQPGTFGGEILRSTAGFKNYAISLTMGHIRLYQSIPTPQGRVKYLAHMAAGTLLLGMLALQLKELVKGRDPRPMDQNKVWLAAALQGGGLGIFGDFLFSEQNRFGGGIEQTIAGPVAGLVGDVIRLPVSNAVLALNGEETKLGRDAANFVRYNTPVASSFWPTRVAFDRLVADQLQQMLDPEAEQVWRRQEKKRLRDMGNQTFWERGATLPSRGPDFSNILGGNQ